MVRTDSLFRNSVFLTIGTAVTAVLGFVFWWLCARLFSVEEIGLGTALISGTSLVSYFSLLGVNTAFVRFLPRSAERNETVNSGLLLVAVAATVMAVAYAWVLPWLSPGLDLVSADVWHAGGFVVFAVAAAVNLLTDSVFIAHRASGYNLIVYSVMSLVKVLLVLLAVGLGAYGILLASGVSAVLALVLSLALMVRGFGYGPRLRLSFDVIGHMFGFASSNYVANCLNIAPSLVLPLIVVSRLGAAEAGYFYLAFMIANLLYAIAYAVSQSLFAEGSHSEENLSGLVRRAVVVMGMVLIPASLILAVGHRWLLPLFGKSYGEEAGSTLTVLALSGPGVALYSVAVVLLRVKKQTMGIVVLNGVFAGVIIGLAVAWAGAGLVWVAWAWLVGHVVAGALGMMMAHGAVGPLMRMVGIERLGQR